MDFQGILQEIGNWSSDDAVERGLVTVAGALVATTFAAYKWFRKPKGGQRSRIMVDCEPGEKVYVQLGDDSE